VFGSTYDADLVDQSTGYATGYGAIKKTTDGGKTWAAQSVPLQGNLISVDFVSVGTGWVVGAEGTVFRTTDGGAHWTRQRHDSDRFYTGVSFVNASTGWVSANAHIIRTTDGGAHWTEQSVPLDGDAARIRMLNAQVGWAVGALRTILHTTDGGDTWTLQQGGVYENADNVYPLWGIDVLDASHAVAVGDGVQIETTTDAGATWVHRGNGSPTLPFRLVHLGAQRVWSANSNSEVLRSTDGGVTWRRAVIQLVPCDRCSNTSDVTFIDKNEGWATINGDFTLTSWVFHTTDGGANWESLFVTDTGPLTGIASINRKTLVAVSGADDLIFRSTDGGHTWAPIDHPAVPDFFGNVRFVPGTKTGWAVGANGKILRSKDAGKTWVLQHGGGQQPNLLDVSFADTRHGWAVGGNTLYTSNGGKTWKPQSPGIGVVFGVSAVNASTAWVSGIEQVASTTNAGSAWKAETVAAVAWYSVTTPDASTVLIGGQEQEVDDVPGTIWRHTGSGVWTGRGPDRPTGRTNTHAPAAASPPSG
jgi:photosystem II stability/assembly factor-like uncharacterized protein